MKEFRIFGLRRSGNHTIIEWIAAHFNYVIHYNDCWGWESPDWFKQLSYGSPKEDLGCRIYSYEDFEPSKDELKNPSTILILRDWYNMSASRVASGRGLDSARYPHQKTNNRDCEEVWLKYAEFAQKFPNKIILFNEIINNPTYQESIRQNLGLLGDIKFPTELPATKFGNGSSFPNEPLEPNSLNSRIKVLKKQDLASYKKITQEVSPAVHDYCDKLFGWSERAKQTKKRGSIR